MSNATKAISYLIARASLAHQTNPTDETQADLDKYRALANDPEAMKQLDEELSKAGNE